MDSFGCGLTCEGRTDRPSGVEAYEGCQASRKTLIWALPLFAPLGHPLILIQVHLPIHLILLLIAFTWAIEFLVAIPDQVGKAVFVWERYRMLYICSTRGLVLALKIHASRPLWKLKQAGLVLTNRLFNSHSRTILSSFYLLRFIAITNDVILETTGVSQTFLLHIQILKM